jgi:hypothetical protein
VFVHISVTNNQCLIYLVSSGGLLELVARVVATADVVSDTAEVVPVVAAVVIPKDSNNK